MLAVTVSSGSSKGLKMTDETFKAKLIEQMEKQSLSADDVAVLVDAATDSVRRWVAGTSSPLPIMKRIVMRVLEENDD